MSFASFSTIIAVFENLVSFGIDSFGLDRKKSSAIFCVVIFLTSIPCVLGFNIWKNVHLIRGMDILGSEDFIVSNLLLPVGALVFLLFCVTQWGWGFEAYMDEANTGEGIKIHPWMGPVFKYVLPVMIIIILISVLI